MVACYAHVRMMVLVKGRCDMGTTNKGNGFRVGSAVVLAADYVALVGGDANVIHEVVDSRLANGEYVFTVAPVVGDGYGAPRAVFADDIRAVRDVTDAGRAALGGGK